jgi:hypothetical protein
LIWPSLKLPAVRLACFPSVITLGLKTASSSVLEAVFEGRG